MSILSGIKKVKRYVKTSGGYQLLSQLTSSQTVEMDDGTTLEANKTNWDDKYTKNEIDNKFSTLETNIDWKESVNTYDDIATTYPFPEDGWTVNVNDTDYTYRYNGTEWIAISANAIPKATQSIDGLLSKDDKINYDDANAKKHEHNNKTILDGITSDKISNWDAMADGAVSGVKGNAEEEYRQGLVNITLENLGVDLSDSTSASAIGTSSNIPTERDIYYGLPKINGSHTYTSNTNIYAPLMAGTSGQVLIFTAEDSTPMWHSQSALSVGSATKATQDGNGNEITKTYLPLSGGNMTGIVNLTEAGFAGKMYVPAYAANISSNFNTYLFYNYASYYSFYPSTTSSVYLGTSNNLWKGVYAASSTISTSDRNKKHEISYIGKVSDYKETVLSDDQLEQLIMGIRPVVYKFNDGDSNRPHHGIIAQDFEELLSELEIDHAGFIKSPKTVITKDETGNDVFNEIEGEYDYAFRYEELIGDLIRFVQIQQSRISSLEKKVEILESK